VVPDPLRPEPPLAPWGAVPPCLVFRPTVEEFRDPLGYIASIADVGRQYGICKIIPPAESWTLPKDTLPPPLAGEHHQMAFRTKVQRIHQLKHRNSNSEAFSQVWEFLFCILLYRRVPFSYLSSEPYGLPSVGFALGTRC
jgi:hypothetical protein